MPNFADIQNKINVLLDKIATYAENLPNIESIVKAGETKVAHNVVTEAIFLDENWIKTIEQAFFSIEQIVKNPQKSIVDEQILVNVEKARKVNARSIQYLASHSENVSNIVNGEVRPSKVMTTEFQEDYKTYENRFIFTLLGRLEKFVNARFDDIKSKINVHKTDVLSYENMLNANGVDIKCDLKLTVRDVPRGSLQLEKNYELLRRIEAILKRIRIAKAGNFNAMLESTKPIFPPIIKTNLLSKNVDYNNAYQLWLYISAYTFEGFRIEVERKSLPFDQEYIDDLTSVTTLLYGTTEAANKLRRSIFDNVPVGSRKSKKYKVLTKFEYEPSFKMSSDESGDELINQFYFDEMKRLIGKTTDTMRGDSMTVAKSISSPFCKFYRAMTKISNEIYDNILTLPVGKKTKRKKTRTDVLKEAVKRQNECLKRKKLLSKMKAEELSKTLKQEAKELVKLEKLKFELSLSEDKRISAKMRAVKKKERLKAIQLKSARTKENAARTKEELLQLEEDRQEQLIRERREKFEKIKELRERKLLERLKDKYENNAEHE